MKTVFKVVLGVIIALLIVAIAGAGCTALFVNEVDKELQKEETVTSTSDTTEDSSEAEAPADEAEEPAEETQNIFKIGDTVETKDFQLTVSNKKNNTPTQYQETTHGNIMSFDVAFMNLTGTKSYFDSSEFNLYVDGELMESSYLGDDWGISGDVNAGRTIKGKLFYDAPPEGEVELIFEPSFSWDALQVTFTE